MRPFSFSFYFLLRLTNNLRLSATQQALISLPLVLRRPVSIGGSGWILAVLLLPLFAGFRLTLAFDRVLVAIEVAPHNDRAFRKVNRKRGIVLDWISSGLMITVPLRMHSYTIYLLCKPDWGWNRWSDGWGRRRILNCWWWFRYWKRSGHSGKCSPSDPADSGGTASSTCRSRQEPYSGIQDREVYSAANSIQSLKKRIKVIDAISFLGNDMNHK